MSDTSVPSTLRASRLVRLIVFAAALAMPLFSGGPVRAVEDKPPVLILLDGLCTELSSGAQFTASFAGADGIAARTIEGGFPAAGVLGYSYAGGAVDGAGRWRPEPYSCGQSRDQSLAKDVDLLDDQVNAIAVAHPGARFRLVGFSQGGLVAFAWLARLTAASTWGLPNGARLEGVVTLDSPLGGAPYVDVLCGLAPDVCGGRAAPAADSTLRDMSRIWDTATGHPAGATRSVAAAVSDAKTSNEAIATAAAAHGVRILTVGNVRDWLYAPAGPNAGNLAFLDSQWLTSQPEEVGVFARAIDSGPASCPAAIGNLAASYGCNHGLVLRDVNVFSAIVGVMGSVPELSASCAPGKGGCLALPPRPATVVGSVIAAGIVTGGGKFVPSAVSVKSGGRATLLFTTSPTAAGKPVQIWGRGKHGSYRYMTTRVADKRGIVRYYTPPITAWAAIQARYAGDFVNGPGVSAGRVVTVR